MGKKKGKAAKAARKGVGPETEEEELHKAPHSFVFHRGKVGKNISDLERDIRRVMEPYTAKSLKVNKRNVLKDFVSVAGPLNVSHFMVLSKTDVAVNLRLIRLPRGPTLTFKLHNYTLARDIITSLKRHNMEPKQFQHHPLLVMNNMRSDDMQIKLMMTMFQNMFPSINVNKVKLKALKRCVIFSYNEETKMVDFRHYNIRAVPVGLGRGVKKLTKTNLPNLSKYDDISEFLLRGDASESEAELDGPHNEVELPQDMANKGKFKTSKSAIRLTEIGPRLTMQLIKVEEGICEGNVLFHEYIHKTEEEIKQQVKMREKKKELKAKRKKEQEHNIEKKKNEKEEIKKKTLAGMKKENKEDDEVESLGGESASEDDDIEYYKQEVGEAPDADLFLKNKAMKRKASSDRSLEHHKKNKKFLKSQNERNNEKSTSNTKFKGKFNKKNSKFERKDKSSNKELKLKEGKKLSKDKSLTDKNKSKTSMDKKGSRVGKKKHVLTDMDRMRRSKLKRQQRKAAKKAGKRRNKPRKI